LPTGTSTPSAPPPPPDQPAATVVPPTPRLVLFLDECIPEEIGARLVEFLGNRQERPRCVHLLEFFRAGTPDTEWLQKIRDDGWLPVTGDRGRSNNGPKLPRLCRELGIIHIVLSARVYDLPAIDRALAIAACWLDIVDVWQTRRGCGHLLQFKDRRQGFKLVDLAERAKVQS
jgi:hypothetical protein